jgi:hypothetical protein
MNLKRYIIAASAASYATLKMDGTRALHLYRGRRRNTSSQGDMHLRTSKVFAIMGDMQ